MFTELLYVIAGRCPTHDKASPYLIARLEVELGIDPNAMTTLKEGMSITDALCNPNLISCSNEACEARRRDTYPPRPYPGG
ncbi:hypothetical protein [Streptomyces tauricus]